MKQRSEKNETNKNRKDIESDKKNTFLCKTVYTKKI